MWHSEIDYEISDFWIKMHMPLYIYIYALHSFTFLKNLSWEVSVVNFFYSKGKQVCMSVTGGIIQQQQQKFTAKISMHVILWYIYRAKFST